jgi:SnoaL-like domain
VGAPRIDDLVEIEAIRQLKVRYCLALDGKDWTLYRSCFDDGARLGGGIPGSDAAEPALVGLDDWVASVAATVGTVKTLHTVHGSIIEIIGPASAHGLWQYTQRGWGRTGGYYTERYVKTSGAWKIASMVITPVFANHGDDATECPPGSFEEIAALWPALSAPWFAAP